MQAEASPRKPRKNRNIRGGRAGEKATLSYGGKPHTLTSRATLECKENSKETPDRHMASQALRGNQTREKIMRNKNR